MLYNTPMMSGPRFDEVGSDGVRRIGTRAGQDLWITDPWIGYLKIPGAPEQVIWTIRPDGTATLSRQFIPYRPELLTVKPRADLYSGPAKPGMVLAMEGNRGGPFYTYNFSADGLKVFRMAASLYPDGVIERGISVNGLQWPAWDFPFTATDAASMKQWVLSLSPAEAFGMYYTLLAYDGQKTSTCQWQKFVPGVSAPEFQDNYFWAVFQAMIIQAIYDVRTDLRKVRDPDTGNVIDGLIKYDQFRMPCKPGIGEIIFEVVASVALGVVSAGAGAALASAIKTIEISKSIFEMKASADKTRATQAFTNSVIKGYSSGTDIANILQPPPELSEIERQLLEKASGESKSPTEVPGGAVAASGGGGGLPWLLIAGAAAALLS